MREHITPKQAAQLSEEQFYSLFTEGIVKRKDWAHFHHKKVTVGMLLVYFREQGYRVSVELMVHANVKLQKGTVNRTFFASDLCDALWEAVLDLKR